MGSGESGSRQMVPGQAAHSTVAWQVPPDPWPVATHFPPMQVSGPHSHEALQGASEPTNGGHQPSTQAWPQGHWPWVSQRCTPAVP